MREKITNLLQKFYKEKGYNIFILGLTMVMLSNFLIKILSAKYGTPTTEIEQISFQLNSSLFNSGMLLGKFILTLGIIKTTADFIIKIQNKLKKREKINNVR